MIAFSREYIDGQKTHDRQRCFETVPSEDNLPWIEVRGCEPLEGWEIIGLSGGTVLLWKWHGQGRIECKKISTKEYNNGIEAKHLQEQETKMSDQEKQEQEQTVAKHRSQAREMVVGMILFSIVLIGGTYVALQSQPTKNQRKTTQGAPDSATGSVPIQFHVSKKECEECGFVFLNDGRMIFPNGEAWTPDSNTEGVQIERENVWIRVMIQGKDGQMDRRWF